MSKQLSRETRISLVLGIGIIVGFGVVLTQFKPATSAGAGDADDFTRHGRSPATDDPLSQAVRRRVPTPPPGRTADIAALEARSPAPRRTCIVRRNDSLTKIARREYGPGNAKHYRLIYEANRAILPNERTLRPGQVLVIPPLSASGTSSIARRHQRTDRSVAHRSPSR